eukprot:TCONS_00013061-protein
MPSKNSRGFGQFLKILKIYEKLFQKLLIFIINRTSHSNQHQYDMMPKRPRNTPNPLCTSSSCVDECSQDVLTCSKCNRSVHFICTRLPPYMITVCKDGRRTACKYICPNCVTVSRDLLAIVPSPGSQPSLKTAAQLSKLKETFKENEETFLRAVPPPQRTIFGGCQEARGGKRRL